MAYLVIKNENKKYYTLTNTCDKPRMAVKNNGKTSYIPMTVATTNGNKLKVSGKRLAEYYRSTTRTKALTELVSYGTYETSGWYTNGTTKTTSTSRLTWYNTISSSGSFESHYSIEGIQYVGVTEPIYTYTRGPDIFTWTECTGNSSVTTLSLYIHTVHSYEQYLSGQQSSDTQVYNDVTRYWTTWWVTSFSKEQQYDRTTYNVTTSTTDATLFSTRTTNTSYYYSTGFR